MKTSHLLFTALLGLGISSAACAQTTMPGAPGVGSPATTVTPITSGTALPGQPGVTSTSLPGSPAPVGTAPTTIYAPGTAPAGTPGALRDNQPVGITPGTAPTRPIRRSPSGTRTNSSTTNSAVRP